MELRAGGKKTNHKKGIAAAGRLRKREEAEARNAEYAKQTVNQKMKTAGRKEQLKLAAKVSVP